MSEQPLAHHIVHLIAPAFLGGAESVVQHVATVQHQSGDSVLVLAILGPSAPTPPFVDALMHLGVSVRQIRRAGRRYDVDLTSMLNVIDGSPQPTIFHCHGAHAIMLGGLVKALRRVTVVGTAHGYTGGSRRNRLYELLDRWSLGHLDGVMAVSPQLYRRLLQSGVGADRLFQVENGLGAVPFEDRGAARDKLSVSSDAVVAGWVGRFAREKAPDLFIDALTRLPGVTGVMIGDPAAFKEELPPVPGNVRMIGPVAQAGRLMRAFDVFVISSRTEGLPITLLEAMAAGVPVVATRVGAVPDVLQGGRLGMLVAPERPQALADAIEAALATSNRELASAAQQLITSRFSVVAWAKRIEYVYRQAIRRPLG